MALQALDCAKLKGQQGAALMAAALIVPVSSEVEGDWHIMPDLITLLTAQWFLPRVSSDSTDGSSSSSKAGWLESLGKMAGDAAKRTARRTANSTLGAALSMAAVHFMLESCTKPDTPSDISDPSRPNATTLEVLCIQ